MKVCCLGPGYKLLLSPSGNCKIEGRKAIVSYEEKVKRSEHLMTRRDTLAGRNMRKCN